MRGIPLRAVKREHDRRAAEVRQPMHRADARKVEVWRFITNFDRDVCGRTRRGLPINERAHNSVVEVDQLSRQFLCWTACQARTGRCRQPPWAPATDADALRV